MAAVLAVPSAALAAADRSVTVTTATTSDKPAAWDGALATGLNTDYDSATASPCGKTEENYCDDTLIKVELPEGSKANVEVDLFDYFPNPASDFDLYVYESNAAGQPLKLVDFDGSPPAVPETVSFPAKNGYYLARVVYFAVTASQYSAEAYMTGLIRRLPDPPEVDTPPGLQEYLASNPELGFKSHSEPHVAQSPVNPDILVAGSKMYYRDRDSLDEYEFKIGTYVSFDRGVTWTDLSQLAVCAPEKSPPASWPATNTCYPDEDPTKGGTGPEDVHSDDPDTPEDEDPSFDDRGSGDIGEEYTTSDVWVQFDDEGNAYAMILDHAPFGLDPLPLLGTEENGWGMSLHKWESPSPEDVTSGKTWGPRVPINYYPDEVRERLFLDDKNTMAVNNAGPDNDGKPGPIIACWGRTFGPAKQTIVCETSTDGGKTFPGEPVPVSEPQNLVIGVHVFPDPKAENTFHLIWNYYVITASPFNQMYYSKTTDAGRTWQPPIPMGPPFEALPRSFPGQTFRNLSIPIAAAAPNGDLYATWAEMRAAPNPATDDGDDVQADIVFTKSTNGGVSWSTPTVVNQDKSNADQFQPYVAVTPQGEIQIAYFDRRNDKPIGTGSEQTHQGNFYVDEYLSRSTDGGAKWEDIRLSHDMSDPEHKPPISPSGTFFGDYQGLVADDCFAIPFMQDAHLAEDASRDQDFDSGMPRSDYQEVFAWRVPNAKQGASCTKPIVEGPAPPVTEEGLPRVSVTAPRLATDVSTDNRFKVRINAAAANIDFYQLQYKRPTSKGWRKLSSKLLSAEYEFRGAFSATYEFRARAIALNGKAGPWSEERAITVVPHDDRRSRGRPRYTGSWRRVKASGSYVRRVSRSSRRGSRMRMNIRGNRVYLVGRRSPEGGKARVIVNGRVLKTISFYSSKVQNRRVLYSAALSTRRGNRFEVVVLGRKGSRKSKGRVVEIDAVGYRTP